MKVTISPSAIHGVITAPASKSAMQRACAAALLKKGRTVLINPGISADDKAALQIIQQLGGHVEYTKEGIFITSNGIYPVAGEINCGESGLSLRMFTSIAAVSQQKIKITGHGSLTKRPMHFFDEVLPQLGVKCKSNSGFLPLEIHGPLQPKNISIDGSLSSQFLTGLLFAYASSNASNVSINVHHLASKPYVDLTLNTLRAFGMNVPENKNYEEFTFHPFLNAETEKLVYAIESDWSNAAFLLVAGALAGSITLQGLDLNSVQGDKRILDVLKMAGVSMKIQADEIIVSKSDVIAFDFDATDCPDLFPPLVALACYCKGTSIIKGVHRLTHKESNRAVSLQSEFSKMNVSITISENAMYVEGNEKLQGAT
ncbi:MAG TPA: 3-phosphoshikimate 1-carboxyvinyltransferase, partial [Chitinophagaceae bacterium]|nr:3-phosphoshikimate 1-carboxyvinyltransferase [Chitinophagaceae bacterium]